MENCIICGKYSIGNKYCFDCYQEMLQNAIIKVSNTPNTCIKCNKEIRQLIYCEECYRKHVALDVDDILLKYYNDFDPKKDESHSLRRAFLGISKEKCICCNDKAMLGSKYCEKHHPSFIDFSSTKNETNNINSQQRNPYYEYCIYCQQPSYGNPYCYKCYDKYYKQSNNKKINIYLNNRKTNLCQFCCQISDPYKICKDCYNFIKKNNQYYTRIEEYEENNHNKYSNNENNNKQYVCENGLIVKSQGERTISDFLYRNHIPHQYEKKLHYREKNIINEKSIEKSIKPDFYIEGPVEFNGKTIKDIYIEFFGLKNNVDYDKSNEYKKQVYSALSTTVIIIYPKDIEDYKKSLTYKLSNYKENKINFFEES